MARWVLVRKVDVPTLAALAIGVVAVSSSAPLIAYAVAPALAIAFWRNTLAVGVLAPAAAARGRTRAQLTGLLRHDRRTALVCVLAGLALAVHFGTWIPSAKLTSVATATALVSTMPIWSALIVTAQGARPPLLTWTGIGIAVAGALLATGADFAVSTDAVLGDVLALVGGVASAVYTALGERARTALSTVTYTTVCYTACGLALGAVCLAGRVPLGGYPASAWLAIAAMTAGAQLLGHNMFSFALRRVPAITVSVLLLLEVPGATVFGWLLIGQLPRAESVPGLVVLTAGVAVVLVGTARAGGRQARGTSISPDAIVTT